MPWRPHCLSRLLAVDRRPARTEEDADELAGDEVAAIQPFHPDFTYPIFGDKETIFGYRNPEIKVRAYVQWR